jgi:hypothetical protein
MDEIETDYLVVGAGATGMAFVDALIAGSDTDVVMVDRRPAPGGHWLDDYPFVRLHQPSACYGVDSRVLGNDRIDDSGPNAGFYERATGPEIIDYYSRVLEEHLIPSGRVRFFGSSDYLGGGPDGHRFVSTETGAETRVRVRRKLVDATYVHSEIPSRHTPEFEIGDGVRVIPPNDLVDLAEAPTGYTILGAGKTSMDTCSWLLDQGVDPDRIRWVRPRDGWFQDRALFQPLDLVGSYMQVQGHWIRAVAETDNGSAFAHLLEDAGILARLDPSVEAETFRGATLSQLELASLRRIENVVRLGKVRRAATDRITLEQGEIASDPDQVLVDCTAAGISPALPRAIFEPDRITPQMVTIGFACWSAATLGKVEASRDDDAEKNRLCPPLTFNGRMADVFDLCVPGILGLNRRSAEPDLDAWNNASRLNPGRGVGDHLDDPRILAAFDMLGAHFGPAMSKLERLAAESV